MQPGDAGMPEVGAWHNPARSANDRPPIICLMGPTAAGKTELATRLVDELPVDLVSVDSAMVYRGMDVGTAKPDPDMRRRYPHRLVDIVEPEDPYSAGRFVADARREIQAIHGIGRIPLLVGGTSLYFRALLEGLHELPEASPRVRAALDREARELGWAALHERLAGRDPEAAARIHPHDAQRIQRALEILAVSGRGPTRWYRERSAAVPEWTAWRIILMPDRRAELHKRIERRFHQMMAQGFLEEVEGLRSRPGMRLDFPSMRAVGYRQLWQHLEGRMDREEAIYRGIVATRQLAKRQVTWLRRQPAMLRLSGREKSATKLVVDCLRQSGLQPKTP